MFAPQMKIQAFSLEAWCQIMKQKSWKQKIATVLVCALVTGTISTNTAFASGSRGRIATDNILTEASHEITKDGVKESIGEGQNSPEWNRILENCKEVKADKSSTELKRGESVSVESISRNTTKMAILSNGDLYCWGYNKYGQVGNGTTKTQLTPIKVLSDVKSVSYSSNYPYSVAAILSNGDLYCWGYNGSGQVGNGTTKTQLTPIKVLSDVKSVSYSSSYASSYAYYSSVAAILSNGDLYCWGYNGNSQVGNGTTKTQLTPIKVLSDVKSVSYSYSYFFPHAYYYSVAAILSNGDLYCWGYNGSGQVGNGTTKAQLTPIKVLSDVKSVSYSSPSPSPFDSESSVAAILSNGDLYCWGYNGNGEVGNGTTKAQLTPIKVLSDVKFISYSSNYFFSVAAILLNGDLYCWGYNGNGEVGNGTTKAQLTPIKVLSDVKSVSYFSNSSVAAILSNGDLYCWGHNCFGEVGNGTTEAQLTPIKVLSDVKSVSYISPYSVAAILSNGDLYCWGCNEDGQVGNGTREDQTTPIKVLSDVKSISYSYSSVAAILSNGDLYCWGYNGNGEVGNGTTKAQFTPIKVLSDVKSVSYSSNYSSSVAAILSNGDLYCWGNNEDGQVGNGTTEDQTTPVKISFPTATVKPTKKPSSVKVGKKVTVKDRKYKVTSVSSKREVQFLGVKKKTKNIAIPASMKISGKSYQVTSIAANALYKNKKMEKLTIGKNVKKIGKNAFRDCEKLRQINVKTKKLTLKAVGKNAFKGVRLSIKISAPKSKVKLYKKIIRERGLQ